MQLVLQGFQDRATRIGVALRVLEKDGRAMEMSKEEKKAYIGVMRRRYAAKVEWGIHLIAKLHPSV